MWGVAKWCLRRSAQKPPPIKRTKKRKEKKSYDRPGIEPGLAVPFIPPAVLGVRFGSGCWVYRFAVRFGARDLRRGPPFTRERLNLRMIHGRRALSLYTQKVDFENDTRLQGF